MKARSRTSLSSKKKLEKSCRECTPGDGCGGVRCSAEGGVTDIKGGRARSVEPGYFLNRGGGGRRQLGVGWLREGRDGMEWETGAERQDTWCACATCLIAWATGGARFRV